MARINKLELIEQFNTLFEEVQTVRTQELKPLLEQGKITTGSYYYVLNPFENYGYKMMYGTDKKGGMVTDRHHYKVWNFQYALNELKELQREILEVVENNK